MSPREKIEDKKTNIQIEMINLDEVKILDDEAIIFSSFHKVREIIHRHLGRNKELIPKIEELNRNIACKELMAYLSLKVGEREGFSLYFRERFLDESK